jgi:polyhydroxyalkanoate synthase
MDNKLEELFTNITKINQDWFSSLIANKEQLQLNPMINLCKNFFAKSKEYLELQHNFYAQQFMLWSNAFKTQNQNFTNYNNLEEVRFRDQDWQSNPFFFYLKNLYLNFSNYVKNSVVNLAIEKEKKDKMLFFIDQYLDSIAPSNFPFTNPEVIKELIKSNGLSLIHGVNNFLSDVKNGYIKMTAEDDFKIGENIGKTEGNILFKNELIELIHYTPIADKVYSIPLLIIPPFINKYYILDLQEKNSFVRFLLSCGYNVYLISWRSANIETYNYTWDLYIERGIIPSLAHIYNINHSKVNTLGYCIGGTLLDTAFLVLKQKGLDYINSITNLTAMLDFTNSGDIRYYIDDMLIKYEESNSNLFASGKLIAYCFSLLRAKELIWNYWVNNYLLGKTPKSFDILFWNNDTIDLPIKLHTYLLKNLYLNNNLLKNNIEICGVKVDLKQIDCPMYLFATQKDHIVPWDSVYKTISLVASKSIRFVLGESGHTAGVINPVTDNKRGYWVNDNNQVTNNNDWLSSAKNITGSWWKDYSQWLLLYSGELKKITPKQLQETNKLYSAPGHYVLDKSKDISDIYSSQIILRK